MRKTKITRAVRLDDGRVLVERPDGSYRPLVSKTNHKRLAKMTDAQITAAAKSDPDNPPMDVAFFKRMAMRRPRRKSGVFLRLDPDILSWFRKKGRGYQTRINAALRAFVEAQHHRHV